jgi:hypothetical protein
VDRANKLLPKLSLPLSCRTTENAAALTLPPTVHLHGAYRVWQRRFYDLKVWSEKKRREKLNYMHGHPV